MRIRRFIGELCIFKHRASSSENESRAAQHIYQVMRSIGLVSHVDSFRSQKRMTWELITIMFFFVIEVILYFYIPELSLAAGLIGIILFWGYFTTRFKPLAPLFQFAKSQNVVGRWLNPDAPYKIIFTAHYDTARSGPLWNPKTVHNFRINFIIGFLVLIFLQIILSLRVFLVDLIIFKIIVILIGLYTIGHIVVLLYAGLKGELVQGASDNASGVAVMLNLASELKEKSYPEIEFWFVATGSEEVGAVGMTSFLRNYKDEIEKNNTYFINFDNVGQGNLHYYQCEGMLNTYRFSKQLITVAQKTAQLKQFKKVTPAKYKLAYTDAIVPASRGYHSILFLATDDRGLIPNWHWRTDTVENLDLAVPQLASDFALEMVKNLYATLKQQLEKNKEELNQLQRDLADLDE